MVELLLLTFAFVLFCVAAYLSPDLGAKLTRIAFALVTLSVLLSGTGITLHR